jgi:signal transduction histidine kinase
MLSSSWTRRNGSVFVLTQAAFYLFVVALCAYGEATPPKGYIPLTSIRSLLDHPPSQSEVSLRGSVTYIGRELVVQDQTGAIAVDTRSGVGVSLGDEVEISGQLDKRPGIPIIRNAKIQVLWAGSTPLPLAMSPDDAAEGAYNGMLVSTEGRLIKAISDSSNRLRLTVESGSQLFTCALDGETVPGNQLPEVGATIRCTGVLAVEPGTVVLETGTFAVLMRSSSDVRLLTAAPWWSPRHLILLFVSLSVFVWIGYRVHLKNIQARMKMIMEERSRIAREIHDTLAQGFAGIALQLQSLDRTLEKPTAAAINHLDVALQMVRRCRAEAHRSIATLRTLHSDGNLASMAQRLLRQLIQSSHLRLIVKEQGIARPFSDEVATQILRITQEAVANIIEHAQATTVTVWFQYQVDSFLLEIIDDGRGFDPERVKSVDEGHFGIAGMRERAAQIGAVFTIESGRQSTALRLKLPFPPTRATFSWTTKYKKGPGGPLRHRSSLDR